MWREKWCNWLCNLPGQAVISNNYWWEKRDNMTSTKGVHVHSPRDSVRLISSSMQRSGSPEGQNHQTLTFFSPKSFFFPPMWQCRESFTFAYLSNFKEPRSVQSTTPHWQTPAPFTNGRMGRKEINNKPGVFFLPPRTFVSPLRHKKHSAGWISVTKLSRGEALQPARPMQSCLSAGPQQCSGFCRRFPLAVHWVWISSVRENHFDSRG